MKSFIQMKDELDTHWLDGAFRLFRSVYGRLRLTTVFLSGAAAGILSLTLAEVARSDDRDKVEHVLLISVDGMHQSDLAWYVQTHPNSTLAILMAQGINYSNASTP